MGMTAGWRAHVLKGVSLGGVHELRCTYSFSLWIPRGISVLEEEAIPIKGQDRTKGIHRFENYEPTQLMLANSSCYFLYLTHLSPVFLWCET